MKILLVEDNVMDADLTKRGLKNAIPDCTLEITPTLKQAKKLIKESSAFDIALLDMKLPDGNGLDLLMEIRKSELNTAVVMLTGSGDEETAVAALKAGADNYMVKHQGYISKLPQVINFAIGSFQQNLQLKLEIIEVLYIEHNASDIDFTVRHLKQYAPYIHVNTVPTAEAALDLLPENSSKICQYRVLLMDYRLPGLNALEFIKIIRQERKLCIPIIMVTGQGNEEVAVQAQKLGVNEYLMKRDNYLYRLPSMIVSAYQFYEIKHKQAALAESEAKYRLLAENAADVIFVLDMNLNFTYISPAVKSLRGFEPDEVLKQKIADVITPDSYKKAMEVLSEILSNIEKTPSESIEPRDLELEIIRKDKTTVWTEVKASLLIDENRKPAGILGVTRDITARKYILEELKKLSLALEQSPASIIITDTKGKIEYVNSRFTENTGYATHEVLGENPRFLKSGHTSKEEYTKMWETITQGKDWFGEFYNKRKDGTFFWEQASISSIKDNDGRVTHYLSVKEDITDKKKFEVELIKAKEKAEESDRLKTAFLHNISHEIRTPMNAITGFASLLNDSELSPDKRLHYTEVICNSSDQLLSIITDIINIATIEAGQEKVVEKTVNLNYLLDTLFHQYEPRAKEKDINLNLKIPHKDPVTEILTDEIKLIEILANLINNALKFTHKGEVNIAYTVKKTFLEFSVSDTGIGISADMHEKIFERFLQVDQTVSREYEGTGLGLSITKAYVELLGGDIWLTSQLGKGSVFYFTIPFIEKPSAQIPGPPVMELQELYFEETKTILVAEDEEMNYYLIEEYLEDTNLTLVRARNGVEAFELCKSDLTIDLVLMDIKMPRMDGYDATRKIRAIKPDLPIVAITAYAQAEDEGKALNAGCTAYIPKPVSRKLLHSVIGKFLLKESAKV